MPIARSSLVGAATGVVLLAGAVGFGVGLPKVSDEQYGSATVPTLPDRINDEIVAMSALTPEALGAKDDKGAQDAKKIAAAFLSGDAKANDQLSELYGDATVRTYINEKTLQTAQQSGAQPAKFTIAVVSGDAGLVIPGGPIPSDVQGQHYELKKLDGATCATVWADPVDPTTNQPNGQQPTAADYFQVECRAEANGLTYDIFGSYLTTEQAVTYLHQVIEQTKS